MSLIPANVTTFVIILPCYMSRGRLHVNERDDTRGMCMMMMMMVDEICLAGVQRSLIGIRVLGLGSTIAVDALDSDEQQSIAAGEWPSLAVSTGTTISI